MTDLIWHRQKVQITPVTGNNTSQTQGNEGSAGVLRCPRGIISTGPSGLQSREILLLFGPQEINSSGFLIRAKSLHLPNPAETSTQRLVYHAVPFNYRENISGVCLCTKCLLSVLLFPGVNA